MTADWRATLERVAEKLAGIWTFPNSSSEGQQQEALALVRGLLAEPQPDEDKNLALLREARPWVAAAVDAAGWFDHDVLAKIDATLGSALAEPQVNPSEAKGLERERGLLRAFDQIDSAMHELDDAEALDAIVGIVNDARAGLLAEGEESREPRLVHCFYCHKTHAIEAGEKPCGPAHWREVARDAY